MRMRYHFNVIIDARNTPGDRKHVEMLLERLLEKEHLLQGRGCDVFLAQLFDAESPEEIACEAMVSDAMDRMEQDGRGWDIQED